MYNCVANGMWNETYNNCDAILTANLGINTTKSLAECFHVVSNANGYRVYESDIQITSLQNGPIIRDRTNIRTFVTSKPIQLRFPTMVNVSLSNINSFGAANVLSDFVSQTFDPITGQVTLNIYTSVQSPYTLTPLSSQIIAGLLNTTNITPVSDPNYNCNSTASNICEQLWQVVLTPTNGQCVLNGTLMVNFTVGCQTSYQGSCSSLSVPYYGTTVAVSSFNVCPELIQKV